MLNEQELVLLKETAAINALLIGRLSEFRELAMEMRRACPVPGNKWDKFMTVLLAEGQQIPHHHHKRHTVLFYPEDCEATIINGNLIHPEAGEIVHLDPGIPHSVPVVRFGPRLSVAMLVSDVPLEV